MANKTIVVKRVVKAPIEKVWKAWTVASQMREWFSPESLTTPEVTADIRVGGEQMIHMRGSHHAGGSEQDFINTGVYKDIDPMKKLVFTWQWQNDPVVSEVSVELKKVSDTQTEVILIHIFPNAKAVGMHPQGWESTFNKLERFFK